VPSQVPLLAALEVQHVESDLDPVFKAGGAEQAAHL